MSGEICNYHINRSVIQGFLALRKAVTTHVKKYCIVYVCWCSQSAAYTSLAFGATRSGWWMNGKAFTILNTSCLSELSRIMAVKTLKNPYRWQTMRFKLSWKGKKTIIPKEKPCVNSTSIKLNTQREIPYLRAPIYHSLYYSHFEISGGPCNLIVSNWCDLFTNRTIFCFKSHLFPSQWGGYTKNKTTNQISKLV